MRPESGKRTPTTHSDGETSSRPNDGVTFAATTLADLLARFEPALESLARARAGFVDRRRRCPGSV